MSSSLIQILSARLLGKKPFPSDPDEIQAQLEQRCGAVDRIMANVDHGTYAFAYRDYMADYQEGRIPAQTMISIHPHNEPPDSYEAAYQQSWSWQAARAVVETCTHSVMVNELMAGGLPPAQRTALFRHVLMSLLSLGSFEAIYFISSGQFLPVQAYQESQNPMQGLLNVRMFNIANGAPQEAIMDTLGLAPFGLPDVQCHFTQLDPNLIAPMVYNVGHYLYERGDVIEDGHTVPGVQPNSKWVCQHEMAIIAPERPVLDICPDAPYAAGNRS